MPGLTAGERVELRGVEVESVDGNTIWVRNRGTRVAVLAPDGSAVRAGQRIDVIGSAERDGDRVRVRATRVDVK